MRKLPFPTFDDVAAIEALATNDRLGSFPKLMPLVKAIKDGYAQYHASSGNAQAIAKVNIPAEEANWLRKHYKSPPICLEELDEIREENLALPCSMCGSLHAHTLDHVLPKEDHPSFAVFSRNLVPACDCNLKRGRNFLGNAAGARVLHPYYDACLDERIFTAKFTGIGATAIADVVIVVDAAHGQYAAIEYHLDMIIKKTGVLNWLRKQWVKFIRAPKKIVGTLNFIPTTEQSVIDAINEHLADRDWEHDSPNNWESMFAHGLLDPAVTNWLYQRLSAVGRGVNDPVVLDAL